MTETEDPIKVTGEPLFDYILTRTGFLVGILVTFLLAAGLTKGFVYIVNTDFIGLTELKVIVGGIILFTVVITVQGIKRNFEEYRAKYSGTPEVDEG